METDKNQLPIMLPKYRYDEINQKYKETKRALQQTQTLAEAQGEEIAALRDKLQQMQIYLKHSMLNLRVKELFVEGGITKAQYETIIPKMTCKDEEKLPLAEAIVELIQNKEKEKR